MIVLTAAQMQKLDRLASEQLAIPGLVLMENAGAGVARLIDERFPDDAERGVVILCGPGNNGGDGFVIARHLFNLGCEVELFLLGASEKLRGDAKTNHAIAANMDLPIAEVKKAADLLKVRSALSRAGLVVDALFGTGLDRPIEGLGAELINLVNKSKLPVVAVDIPSGLSADTGKPWEPAIRADLTATFALAKLGHYLLPGSSLCGQVEIVDISLPQILLREIEVNHRLIDTMDVLALFVPRDPEGHKGDYGHAAVIGGSRGMSGAVVMATTAAVRSGAGLVTAVVPEPLLPIAESSLLESLKAGLPADPNGLFSADALEPALELAVGKSVLAIGPGLGRSPGVTALVHGLARKALAHLVVDADGLNALVGALHLLPKKGREVVLTPHPGEAARLLNMTVADVQDDRLAAARELARRSKSVVVLKGARTLVAEPRGQVWINPTGNAGMATGGMGDVLTGMIAGFIAEGVPPLRAAIAGVYLHGLAGDLARNDLGEHALTAGSVLSRLPAAFGMIEQYFAPPPDEDQE